MSEEQYDETAACVIGDKPHRATHGYLCSSHFERLGAMLRDVEDEAALLSPVPSMQQRGGRGGSLASHRSPARLNVLVHTDRRRGTGMSEDEGDAIAAGETLSVLDVFGSWGRIIREERHLSAPDRVTISGERDLWTRNLEWIAAQLWVDDAYGEIKALLGQLRGVNGTRPDRPYSHCPVTNEYGQCTGQVWIHDEVQLVWRRYPDRCARDWEKAPGAAVCDTCAAIWATPAEKARLRKMCDDTATELTRPRTEDGEPMQTAAEIAADKGVSVNAIRLRLSKAGVRAEHGGYYDPRWLDGHAERVS